MIRAHQAFDVQTSLARITRLRVDTRALNDSEVLYIIGFKWNLALDEDELDRLYDAVESDAQFREVFDTLKATCLTFAPFQASR